MHGCEICCVVQDYHMSPDVTSLPVLGVECPVETSLDGVMSSEEVSVSSES